jgi:hypothetical protein
VEDVKRLIAEVADDGSWVNTVLVCVNARVMDYPTRVGTMRGTLSSEDERARSPASEKQRFQNLQAFFALFPPGEKCQVKASPFATRV